MNGEQFETKLRNIINLKVNENNINEFGRFDELLQSGEEIEIEIKVGGIDE